MRWVLYTPWFRGSDWPLWQRLLGSEIPATWDDWSAQVQRTLGKGPHARFLLVTVKPGDFQRWCREQDRAPSVQAIDAYVAAQWHADQEGGAALAWQISSAEKMVVADVVDRVGPTDFHDFLNALARQDAMPFRKLIDLSLAPGLVRASSISTLSKTLGNIRRTTPLGPVAFVVESDLARVLTEKLIGRMRDQHRMRIFERRFDAFEWLKSRPVPRPRKDAVQEAAED